MKNKSDSIRGYNLNESEPIRTKFSILINTNRSELGLIHAGFSIRINPNHTDLEFIRIKKSVLINLSSYWFGLKTWFRLNWNESDWVGFIFNLFSSNKIQNVFWIGWEWLGMVRKQIPECLGIALIRSEWIWIRNFCQGRFTQSWITALMTMGFCGISHLCFRIFCLCLWDIYRKLPGYPTRLKFQYINFSDICCKTVLPKILWLHHDPILQIEGFYCKAVTAIKKLLRCTETF